MRRALMQAFLKRAAAWIVAAVFCTGTCAVLAQDAPSVTLPELGDRFARVEIRAHAGADPVPAMLFDIYGEWFVRGTALVTIIAAAYDVPAFRVVDGPEWIHATNLYDIDAVPPPAELVKSDNMELVRTFLAEHFDLELRASAREMTVMALELVQETPGLQRTETPEMLRLAPGQRKGIAWRGARIIPGQPMSIHAELTLEALADFLSQELQRPVVDTTGLDGVFTLHLDDVVVASRLPVGLKFEPLLERLGLRVAERTLMLDVLEVVNVAHPQLDEAAQGALERPTVNDQ